MTITSDNPVNPLAYGGNPDLTTALKGLKDSHHGYDTAEQYYDGVVPEQFASLRLRRALIRSGLTYQFGFAATPVDAVVERLSITSITSEDDAQQQAIEAVWKANKLGLGSVNVHRKACTFGDAYVFVWPDDEDPTQVNVFFQDPRTCRVYYDPENPLKVLFAVKKWILGSPEQSLAAAHGQSKPPVRMDLMYGDRIEQYVSRVGTEGSKAEEFVPFTGDIDDDDDGPSGHVLDNPYGQVPIFHFRTDADEYGTPEHRGFYSAQDAIHKLLLTHLSGVEYQSFNQRWALMNDDSDSSDPASLDEGRFAIPMSDIGTTQPIAGEAQSQLQGGPDSLFMSSGIKQFGEFNASDPKVIFDPVDKYLAYGAHITRTPISRFQMSGGQPAAESLKIVDRPFVFKVDNRKLSFSQTWQDAIEFALKILGFADPSVEITWAPSETSDSLADWETAQAKQNAGVPVEQTLKENGYTDEQVSAWDQDGEATLARRLDQLVKFGDAMGALAPAQAAGLITEEQVQAVVQAILGDMQDTDDVPAAE